jgi:ABC-2 type transport system ATP-binding protein
MREAEQLCDRVAVIRQGKLVAMGDPDGMRARAGGSRIEIDGKGFDQHVLRLLRGAPNVAAVEAANGHLVIDLQAEAAAAPLVRLLVGADGQLEEVRRGVASLEEVFLTLMQEEPPHTEGGR